MQEVVKQCHPLHLLYHPLLIALASPGFFISSLINLTISPGAGP